MYERLSPFLCHRADASLCALLVGCPSTAPKVSCTIGSAVTAPSADSTAPSLVADVFLPNSSYDKEKLQERLAKLSGGVAEVRVGADGIPVAINTGGTVQAITSPSGGTVTVIAKAIDPEGVQDIQIWAGERRCRPGDTASCSAPVLGRPSASNPDATAPGGSICTQRLVTQNLQISKTTNADVSQEVLVIGRNFGGQETRLGRVIVRVQ